MVESIGRITCSMLLFEYEMADLRRRRHGARG